MPNSWGSYAVSPFRNKILIDERHTRFPEVIFRVDTKPEVCLNTFKVRQHFKAL